MCNKAVVPNLGVATSKSEETLYGVPPFFCHILDSRSLAAVSFVQSKCVCLILKHYLKHSTKSLLNDTINGEFVDMFVVLKNCEI
jgi:hypothetical protein